MARNMISSVDGKYLSEKRHRRNWKSVVSVLGCLVVIGTISGLTLPAITMNRPDCGLEEHQHSTACYGEEKTLVCTAESLDIHQHTEDCFDADDNVICHYADFVIHTHDSNCYDAKGKLVCTLPEVEEHRHDKSCYRTEADRVDKGHQHDDDCYEWVKSGKTICGQEAAEAHTHTDQCRNEDGEIACGQTESSGHTHDDSCYELVRGELICGEEERDPSTEPGKKTLICDKPEVEAHTHSDGMPCYRIDNNSAKEWLCEKLEVKEHQHTEDCFETEQVLVCQTTEHTHDDSCVAGETEGKAMSEEEQQQAADVVSIIEGLPPVSEIEAEFDRLAEDTDALAAYREKIISAVQDAFDSYHALTEEQKTAVTNAAKLTDYAYLLEAQPEEPDYTASSENVSAVAKLDGFTMPDGTSFVVDAIDSKSEAYLNAKEELTTYLTEQQGKLNNFTLLDLHFDDAKGNKIEPSGSVTVTLTFANPILPGDGTIHALHFAKGGIEDVTGQVERSDAGVSSITFQMDSFSTVAIASVAEDEVGEVLDGDYAYLSDVQMVEDSTTASKVAIRTGTAPFDTDSNAGNDSGDLDNVLRTFDTATYTVKFTSRVRENAPHRFYKHGKLYFEFILQGSKEEVQFDTSSMGWIKAKNAICAPQTEEEIGGKTYQVLRGYFDWYPDPDKIQAIGEAEQSLGVVVRALALNNGDTLQPQFTFFLDHNDVGVDYSNWGKAEYNGGVVTGNGKHCSAHPNHASEPHGPGDYEQQTVTPPAITISAAPSYNLYIHPNPTTTAVGTWDFSTNLNGKAVNTNAGTVYGRLGLYGVAVQITGKLTSTGYRDMRGVEMPKNGEKITFKLSVSSSYKPIDGTGDKETTDTYTPLIWSVERNQSWYPQNGDRAIPAGTTAGAGGIPFAYTPKSGHTGVDLCYQAGDWTAQDGDNGAITVSIEGWKYSTDVTKIPYTYNGSGGAYVYFNPNTVKNYWEIPIINISAGEVWVVQPFENKEGTLAVDEFGPGTFKTVLKDFSLMMTTQSGQTLEEVADNSNQSNQGEDEKSMDYPLTKSGSISANIYYADPEESGYGHPLTDGCLYTGRDWILQGNTLRIRHQISHDSAEGEATGVAYDQLIKWDDELFQPEQIDGNGGGSATLWAAKPDQSGWRDDDELKQATPDDLIFFDTLQELEDKGYTCVGVLVEYRGLASTGINHLAVVVDGKAKMTAQDGSVYMISMYDRMWNRKDLSVATGKPLDEILQLDGKSISQLVQKAIPSRKGNNSLRYAKDYAKASWVNGGHDGKSQNTQGILNFEKASYTPDGQFVSGTGGFSWGDSCLVVGYQTGIDVAVAQRATNETGQPIEKVNYDMDTAQRVVDYVVAPKIVRTAGESITEGQKFKTTVTAQVTLPKNLTYIEGSSYIGGEYQQTAEGKQGTVDTGNGGAHLTDGGSVTYTDKKGNPVKVRLEIQKNASGETVLTYVMEGVVLTEDAIQLLDEIHLSCTIGKAGDEANDVKNNDALNVSATIKSTEDCRREFAIFNGNKDECSILISKNSAVNLSKFADTPVVELNEDMGFTMNVGNSSQTAMDVIAVDSLPYEGDGVSSFTGPCKVTEFSVLNAGTGDGQVDLSDFKFYYTTREDYRGKESKDYTAADFVLSKGWMPIIGIKNGSPWSSDKNVVAIAAVGSLAGGKSLKLHITLSLEEGKAGDYAVNKITNANLSSSARCRIVSRSLEGLTWIDENHDGIQNNQEKKQSGVNVTLLKLNETTKQYEELKTIETGKQIDVLNRTAEEDYEEGRYLFKNLLPGTYQVKFTSGDGFQLQYYYASPVNVGDDTLDSDGVPTYGKNSNLEQTLIENIVMPPAKELTYGTHHVEHMDSGFYGWGTTLPETGGTGTFPYIFSGLALMGAAALVYSHKHRKRKEAR